MLGMDLGSAECGGYAVVALRGELDLIDAADVADALETFAAREPRIIVELSGLEFIEAFVTLRRYVRDKNHPLIGLAGDVIRGMARIAGDG